MYYLQVSGKFILTINLVNYTNPTGLCAECRTRLINVTSADQLVPVCCDDLPVVTANCDNSLRTCDTRFRWTLRTFGASLETRPGMGYSFTDCKMSPSTCPFSEVNKKFYQNPTAILGVSPNPLLVSNLTLTSWTVSSFSLLPF